MKMSQLIAKLQFVQNAIFIKKCGENALNDSQFTPSQGFYDQEFA